MEPDGPWKRPGVFQSSGLGERRPGSVAELADPILLTAGQEVGAIVTLPQTVSVVGTKILT